MSIDVSGKRHIFYNKLYSDQTCTVDFNDTIFPFPTEKELQRKFSFDLKIKTEASFGNFRDESLFIDFAVLCLQNRQTRFSFDEGSRIQNITAPRLLWDGEWHQLKFEYEEDVGGTLAVDGNTYTGHIGHSSPDQYVRKLLVEFLQM